LLISLIRREAPAVGGPWTAGAHLRGSREPEPTYRGFEGHHLSPSDLDDPAATNEGSQGSRGMGLSVKLTDRLPPGAGRAIRATRRTRLDRRVGCGNCSRSEERPGRIRASSKEALPHNETPAAGWRMCSQGLILRPGSAIEPQDASLRIRRLASPPCPEGAKRARQLFDAHEQKFFHPHRRITESRPCLWQKNHTASA